MRELKKLVCEECGKVFESKTKKRFDTKQCMERNYKKRKFGTRECKECGKEFAASNQGAKYCSIDCMRSSRAIYKECRECGKKLKSGGKRAFCSKECNTKAKKKEYPHIYSQVCAYCGKHVAPKNGHTNKYCSPECRIAAADYNQVRECAVCGKKYKTKNKTKCCSYACQSIATNNAIRQSGKREANIEKTCANCGKVFFVPYFQQWAECCGKSCSGAWYAKKNPDKVMAQRQKRRAREKGAFVEDVNPFDVFKRDNWICQLCGGKINRRLKHPHPMSVSLDHVIPFALGGTHEWGNVQASHLRCNLSKGARVASR